MKKVLMGSVFAMILAAGITTSLAAPGGYRAADRDGICDYAAQSSGWAYTDEDNDGVCDYAGQGAGWRFVDEDNDWTVYTIDDGLSAQIEYMVLVKEDGVEVLTK